MTSIYKIMISLHISCILFIFKSSSSCMHRYCSSRICWQFLGFLGTYYNTNHTHFCRSLVSTCRLSLLLFSCGSSCASCWWAPCSESLVLGCLLAGGALLLGDSVKYYAKHPNIVKLNTFIVYFFRT